MPRVVVQQAKEGACKHQHNPRAAAAAAAAAPVANEIISGGAAQVRDSRQPEVVSCVTVCVQQLASAGGFGVIPVISAGVMTL